MAKVKQEPEIELDSVSEIKIEEIEFDERKEYKVKVLADNKSLKTGDIFTISGNVAKVLYKRNLIKIL